MHQILSNKKVIFFSFILIGFSVYAADNNSAAIEASICQSQPQKLSELLSSTVLENEQLKSYQTLALTTLDSLKAESYNKIKEVISIKCSMAGAITGTNILLTLGALGCKAYSNKSFNVINLLNNKAIIALGIGNVLSTWGALMLYNKGVIEEHKKRELLCRDYNYLISQAIEVILLLYGCKYDDKGILVKPLNVPSLPIFFKYTYAPKSQGYDLTIDQWSL